MQPRSIPKIVSKGVRPVAPAKVEEKPKAKAPSSDEDDDYGDDFEDEEVEIKKEILAKPAMSIKKTASKGNDLIKTKEPERKAPVKKAKEESDSDEDIKSPPAQIKEPIKQKEEELRSFSQDRKDEIVYVDPEMKQLQRERVNYLKDYVALEFENFDNLLEILPSSEYELYVNRIQNGTLANSGDQTNDERATREVQTEDEFQNDFGNQWPEDKNRNVFSSAFRDTQPREEALRDDEEIEDTNKLIEFVKNAYPVMDEILAYQTKNVTSKDKMLNVAPVEEILDVPEEFNEIFQSIELVTAFEVSKNQIFVSYKAIFSLSGRDFPLGLIVEYLNTSPSKYFIALSEVTSLYISINFRHALLGGTKDGSMLLWDLRDSNLIHSKNSHELVIKIKEKEAGRFEDRFVYRFPNYSTDFLGENGHNSSVIRIKDTYSSKNVYEVFSLDEFGKVINWNIAILNKTDASQTFSDPGMNFDSKVKLVKIAEFDITDYYSAAVHENEGLVCSDLDIDKLGTNLFICSQKGLAKVETIGQTKPPKTYENSDSQHGPLCVAVSAVEYLYVGNRDGTMEILSKNYSKPIATTGPFTKYPLTHIVLPKYYPITLRNPSKYLEQLTKPIAFDKDGNIYFFSLDQGFSPSQVENPIKEKANGRPFKLLHIWFESNLDMQLLYSVNKSQLLHLNVNCSKILDVTHEPIMQKQKRVPLLFKVT